MGNRGPQTNTQQLIKEIRLNSPQFTLKQISDQIGISIARVSQVLHSSDMPARGVKEHVIRQCAYCHQPTPNNTVICPGCQDLYYNEYIKCSACGKEICIKKKRLAWLRQRGQKNFYDSRACYFAGRRDKL